VPDIRTLARDVVAGFAAHDLLTYASEIAFQVMTALVPLALFAFALLGFLDFSEVWTRDLAPQVKEQVSSAVFSALCVLTWVVTSLAFGFYITQLADYGSVFGPLASAFLLMTYLYVSACAFLAGAQVDALLRVQLGNGPDDHGFPHRPSGKA
jgi:uncharacterized BrkB/YihY/UPF0761 family membrane protein